MATIANAAGAQFHDLLERHRKIVFKVANTYCRDPHDRADLAQEIVAQCRNDESGGVFRNACTIYLSIANKRYNARPSPAEGRCKSATGGIRLGRLSGSIPKLRPVNLLEKP